MRAFVLLAIVGAVLVAVDGACNLAEAKKCVSKVAASAATALAGKDKSKVCDFAKKFADCSPNLKGCSKSDVDQVNELVKAFNADPFKCNIKLAASGVTAAVVTIILAAAAAFFMK